MRKTLRLVLLAMSMILLIGANVQAEDQVLTIYLCGTTLKSDAYLSENTVWGRPELLASMYQYADSSNGMAQTNPYDPFFFGWWEPTIGSHSGPHHKYIVNGAGTSPENNVFDLILEIFGQINPDIGIRNWENMRGEALLALGLVHQNHPDDDVILNLVGFSRGGITALMVARAASDIGYVKKINILNYDPVPGGLDPVNSFDDDFFLSSKVNQYVGVYSQHERTYMFEPVIPLNDPGNTTTKRLMVRVPGSHETMVGNRQVDGHATYLGIPTTDAEDEDFRYVENIARSIAEQLLSSYEWGNVPFDTDISEVSDRNDFSDLVTDAWSQDYGWMPIWPFIPAFGSYDLCYANLGRDHNLRTLWLTPVLHGRLCFIAGQRHDPEWAWTWPCVAPWPVYVYYGNVEQVYWLDNVVPPVSASTWDVLQSFRGTAPPDSTPPVPDLADLPDIVGQCSASITSPPTATDNTAGVVTGTTTDPLTYTEQGTYLVTWTYDDGNGNTTTQTQIIVVEDTEPPYPDEDELPTVEGQCSAEITVTPTAIDNCSGEIAGTTTDPLSYSEQGTHVVTWTYDDGNGNTTTQSQTVVVQDTTPPVIENLTVTPDVLWPPNHKMVQVNVDIDSFDECDTEPVCQITSVSSNEPENGLGDNDKAPDWQIAGDFTVNLRAERSGPGNGRLYTITIKCTDASGNSSTETVTVTVPHDKGKKKGKK